MDLKFYNSTILVTVCWAYSQYVRPSFANGWS